VVFDRLFVLLHACKRAGLEEPEIAPLYEEDVLSVSWQTMGAEMRREDGEAVIVFFHPVQQSFVVKDSMDLIVHYIKKHTTTIP
jgi:hypothetical protein